MKKIRTASAAILMSGGALFSQTQENLLPESGNVGIGTSNPTVKLDVHGHVNIDSSLVVKDSITIRRAARVLQDMTVEGNTAMQAAAVAQDLKVEGNAYFSQNTTTTGAIYYPNPAQLSTLRDKKIVVFDPTTGALKVGNVSLLHQAIYSLNTCVDANNPVWSSGPGKLFINCPAVKVGIGTDSPQYDLDVRGNGYFSSGIRLGSIPSNTTITSVALIEAERSENATAPWVRMSVRKSNGTNETRFRVDKDGLVYCTSLKVRLSTAIPVPDYVFKPDYALMPLSDLKAYVQQNSHLPNIPAESELRETGLNIEEMQLKLLEKVEELTLYIIDLDAQNQAFNAQNAVLTQEVAQLKAAISK